MFDSVGPKSIGMDKLAEAIFLVVCDPPMNELRAT